MALNSSRLGSNPMMPYQAFWVKGNGQLGLNQRVNELRKEGSWVNVHPRGTVGVAAPPVITNVKASELLKEQLLRVPGLAPKHMVFGGTSSFNPVRAQPAPPIRLHRFLDDFAAETSDKNAMQKPSEAAEINNANEDGKEYDGRIHSYPHKKNGPYTCPKCKGVFATSQLFASHVSSIHYKFESKIERKKRLTARYYKRNARIEWVNGKPTIVWGNNNNSIIAPPPSPTPHPPVRVVAKTECVEELPPPPGFEKPIPPPPGFGKPIPPLVFGKPIPPLVFGKPIPSLVFGKPIPPLGFGKPIPPLGFEKPIPPPPGFEMINSVPGFPLPFGFQKLTVAAPRGVQIKLEIQ